jgi:hypothetical protein
MNANLLHKLDEFRINQQAHSKGKLATLLFLTRRVQEEGLPFRPEKLRTAKQGQVAGLGREAVQKILHDHGVDKVLAEEGGRTSRGSLGLAESYLKLLNEYHAAKNISSKDLKLAESWWIGKVKELFNRQRFKISLDQSQTISALVGCILEAARERQEEMAGLRLEGAVMHYLVGAKLRLIYPKLNIVVRGYSVADAASAGHGDFKIGDTVIHVTTHPTGKLLVKCKDNIDAGLRPLIICPNSKTESAVVLAEEAEIKKRIEIYEAETFVSANLNERGVFMASEVQQSARELIEAYNAIIDEVEQDQSLKIETT